MGWWLAVSLSAALAAQKPAAPQPRPYVPAGWAPVPSRAVSCEILARPITPQLPYPYFTTYVLRKQGAVAARPACAARAARPPKPCAPARR